jgi:hypothetical protein
MKITKVLVLLTVLLVIAGCASGYQKINPSTINYLSKNDLNNITLEYKYDLLFKKYKKKESNNNIKLVAIKITNNSNIDYTFGNNLNLSYENGSSVLILDPNQTFKIIKQSPASYLWYLLLTPMQFYSGSTTTNSLGQYQSSESSFPIGFIIGPGLAGGNMFAASEANKNFRKDITDYNIIGKTIKKGETVSGLLGLQSVGYEALKLKLAE